MHLPASSIQPSIQSSTQSSIQSSSFRPYLTKRAPIGALSLTSSPLALLSSSVLELLGRDFVQRIPTFAVPERIAGLSLDVSEHEMVDVAADEAVDDEAHLESVG